MVVTLLAEGEALNPEFLAHLRSIELTAKDVMSAPVVTVSKIDRGREIAELLSSYRIKRVPVVRDGKIVGIVSRADLVRGQTGFLGRARPPRPATKRRLEAAAPQRCRAPTPRATRPRRASSQPRASVI